jgi:hypothetical protein
MKRQQIARAFSRAGGLVRPDTERLFRLARALVYSRAALRAVSRAEGTRAYLRGAFDPHDYHHLHVTRQVQRRVVKGAAAIGGGCVSSLVVGFRETATVVAVAGVSAVLLYGAVRFYGRRAASGNSLRIK